MNLLDRETPGGLPLWQNADGATVIRTAGNGGGAVTTANGGAIAAGEINSGGNAGAGIAVEDTHGAVAIHGGEVFNVTNVDFSANGGLATARSAPGLSYDTAFVS